MNAVIFQNLVLHGKHYFAVLHAIYYLLFSPLLLIRYLHVSNHQEKEACQQTYHFQIHIWLLQKYQELLKKTNKDIM